MNLFKRYDHLLAPILLLIAVIIYLIKVLKFYSIPTAPDVITAYIPLSKTFLDQGIAFFFNVDSLKVSPMAYIWGALFGAKLEVIKTVNLCLGIPILLMMYRIGKLTYGRAAGLATAYIFVLNPFLLPWLPTALGEPPYYFFTLSWLWGMSEALSKRDIQWFYIGISALGLSLSILTRGVWIYPSLFMLLVLSILYNYKILYKSNIKIVACIIGFGMILPASYMIKNWILFSVPVIDLGSGGALYYGAHSMTNGFEPPLLGLSYEDGGLLHTIEGSKLHLKVAKEFLLERNFRELVSWYFTKISWFSLFTGADVSVKHTSFRILEICFSVIACRWAFNKKNIFLVILSMYLILQLLQSALALYNLRYSTDSFEILLILLSGVGLASIITDIISTYKAKFSDYSAVRNVLKSISIFVFIFIALSIYAFNFRSAPVIQLPKKMSIQTLFSDANLSWKKTMGNNKIYYELVVEVPPQELPQYVLNGLWRYDLKVSAVNSAKCEKLVVSYIEKNAKNTAKPFHINIINDGKSHQYLLGTRYENDPLFPSKIGSLEFKIACDQDVEVTSSRLDFIAPQFKETYFIR